MIRPILTLLFLLGVLFASSCKTTTGEVVKSEGEEVLTDTLSYSPLEEETGL